MLSIDTALSINSHFKYANKCITRNEDLGKYKHEETHKGISIVDFKQRK